MAYHEALATRLRELVEDEPGLVEKKMFGGLAMMIDGNMALGVHGDGLLVRVDPERYDTLMAEPGTGEFAFTGRVAKGMVVVDASACAEDDDLRRWVARGVAFARSLPPK